MNTQVLQHIPILSSTHSVLPPRYSSLEGALSPEAASVLRSCAGTVQTLSNADDREVYPPRYSGVFQRSRSTARHNHRHRRLVANNYSVDSQLGAGLHPFEYHIRTGHGSRADRDQPWATLKLFSRSTSTSSSSSTVQVVGPGKMPKFSSKDLVQGCLELNLDSPLSTNSISLSLIGKIVTGSYDGGSCTFLNHPVICWTRAHGDPRTVILNPAATTQHSASSSSSSIEAASRPKKFDGKLSGRYIWPYSFPFPSEITLQGDDRKSPAPQTFLERGERTTVQYNLVLKMAHGVLRADTKLQAGIVYVPEITPSPASLLRQVAYSQGVRIPGPAADPLGWHESSPAVILGKLSNGKAAKLQCSLSLANPLTYTRGAIIPIHLAVHSSNPETLEGLPESKDIIVRLTRCVQHYQNAADSLSLSRNEMTSPVQHGTSNGPRRTTAWIRDEDMEGAFEEKRAIGQVVWQEPSSVGDTTNDPYIRSFDGEIHLPKDMQPSCGFRLFRISYTVELLSFSNSVLKSRSLPEILLSHTVAIATQHSIGPIPIPATQPCWHGSSCRSRQ